MSNMGPTLNIELFLRSLNEAFVEFLRIIISQKNLHDFRYLDTNGCGDRTLLGHEGAGLKPDKYLLINVTFSKSYLLG